MNWLIRNSLGIGCLNCLNCFSCSFGSILLALMVFQLFWSILLELMVLSHHAQRPAVKINTCSALDTAAPSGCRASIVVEFDLKVQLFQHLLTYLKFITECTTSRPWPSLTFLLCISLRIRIANGKFLSRRCDCPDSMLCFKNFIECKDGTMIVQHRSLCANMWLKTNQFWAFWAGGMDCPESIHFFTNSIGNQSNLSFRHDFF